MLKAADVEILIARTICSGKYFIVVGGLVSDVKTAVRTALEAAQEAIIDHLVIPNVDEPVFPALGQSVASSRRWRRRSAWWRPTAASASSRPPTPPSRPPR